METGWLHDFLGIFLHEMKDFIFVWRGACEERLNPHEVRLKRPSEKAEVGRLK